MKSAILAAALLAAAIQPGRAQDAAAGEKAYAQCRSCHQVGENAKNTVGPILNGFIGQKAGTREGYSYSSAMKDSGLTWDEATFSSYIQNPRAKVPGTKPKVRASGRLVPRKEVRRVPVLGFFAGLLDASGGGGWGPVATSTLLASGGQARTVIGSVSAAEFVVTLAVSITFLLSIGLQHLEIVLGLLVGGMIAAPVAALLVRHVRERWVLVAVGVLVLCLSLYQIGHAVARLF